MICMFSQQFILKCSCHQMFCIKPNVLYKTHIGKTPHVHCMYHF